MKLLARIFQAWLFLCFVLVFFIAPLYFLAIYPDVPEPALPIKRALTNYGAVEAQPSLDTFIYRLIGCGATMALGGLLAYRWLEDIGRRAKDT